MKSIVKKVIVAILLFTSVISNAKELPTLRNLKDGKTTVLTIPSVEQGDVLYMKDLFGQILYELSIQNSGNLEKAFNLTQLEDGGYYFELSHASEIKRIPFTVYHNQIQYKHYKEADISKQYKKFRKKNGIDTKTSIYRRNRKSLNEIHGRTPSFKGGNFINYKK